MMNPGMEKYNRKQDVFHLDCMLYCEYQKIESGNSEIFGYTLFRTTLLTAQQYPSLRNGHLSDMVLVV